MKKDELDFWENEWNETVIKPMAERMQKDIMKEAVTKELVEKVMDHIYTYNSKVSYRTLTTSEVEKYQTEMVQGITKLILDKLL